MDTGCDALTENTVGLLTMARPDLNPMAPFCGYIGSCVDISERKSSEESLHALGGA